jgi:regulator of RNase E activity RraA
LASQLLKRGLRNVFIPRLAVITAGTQVGPAYTLLIPMREDLANAASVANPANPQRAAIEQVPQGHVLVIVPAAGAPAASATFWRRDSRRGVAGVVTDAATVRAARSCAAHLLRGFCRRRFSMMAGQPIGCGGVPIFPATSWSRIATARCHSAPSRRSGARRSSRNASNASSASGWIAVHRS